MLAFTTRTTTTTGTTTTITRRRTLTKLIMITLSLLLLTTQHVVQTAPQQGLNFFTELTQLLNANAATNFFTSESNNNLPSDLSIGNNANQLPAPTATGTTTTTTTNQLSNFLPVNSLIAAAALPETPAPVQFVRTAMNSGLRR